MALTMNLQCVAAATKEVIHDRNTRADVHSC